MAHEKVVSQGVELGDSGHGTRDTISIASFGKCVPIGGVMNGFCYRNGLPSAHQF
jgi:hypothetical protein